MKVVCQYSISRFLPYSETGEFANFGIVLFCPQTRYFGYKLLKRRTGRITAFFEELEASVYRRACQTLENELKRLQLALLESANYWRTSKTDFLTELTRPREAIVRFSQTRAVMTEDPASEVLRLFDHYVQRNFVTPEYKDRTANRAVLKILTRAGVQDEFKQETLVADGYHATFPFVRRDEGEIAQVIKPLHLGLGDGRQIFDHGWQWVGRITRLRELNALPQNILLPVKAPKPEDEERYQQYEAARNALAQTSATVVPIEDERAIRDFAVDRRWN